jgi:hypothetical protein
MEFRGFRLSFDPQEGLYVYKHTPSGKIDGFIARDDLAFISENNEHFSISYSPRDGEEVPLIYTNAGPRSKATLESLYQTIR